MARAIPKLSKVPSPTQAEFNALWELGETRGRSYAFKFHPESITVTVIKTGGKREDAFEVPIPGFVRGEPCLCLQDFFRLETAQQVEREDVA